MLFRRWTLKVPFIDTHVLCYRIMKDKNIASRGKIFLQIIFHNKWGRMFFQFLIYSFALKIRQTFSIQKHHEAIKYR